MMRILTALLILFVLTTCGKAEQTNCLRDQQRVVFDEYDRILEFDDIDADFTKIDLQNLGNAADYLRTSEKYFPSSEPESRKEYLSLTIQTLSLLASRSKTEEKNRLLDECLLFAEKYPNPEYKNDLIEQIRRLQEDNIDLDKIETVEDALKIKDIQYRNLALNHLAQKLSSQTSPNFGEALRAAQSIADEVDTGHRELCFSFIAVCQAKAGQFDEAEETCKLINDSVFETLSTLLTFILIQEEQGDLNAVKKRIDEVIKLGLAKKELGSFMPQFFRFCYSCLVRLKHHESAKYLFEKLVDMENVFEKEFQKMVVQQKNGLTTFLDAGSRWHDKFENNLTLGKAAAHLGNRDTARRYFEYAGKMIAEEEKRWSNIWNTDRSRLIAALFDAGFETEAKIALEDYVAMIPNGKFRFSFNGDTPSARTKNLVRLLGEHGRFTEAISLAGSIHDEEERHEAYRWIVDEVRFRLRRNEDFRVGIDPPRKRFSTVQEILAIAELMRDTPGSTSLEVYRSRIRKYANQATSERRVTVSTE